MLSSATSMPTILSQRRRLLLMMVLPWSGCTTPAGTCPGRPAVRRGALLCLRASLAPRAPAGAASYYQAYMPGYLRVPLAAPPHQPETGRDTALVCVLPLLAPGH